MQADVDVVNDRWNGKGKMEWEGHVEDVMGWDDRSGGGSHV